MDDELKKIETRLRQQLTKPRYPAIVSLPPCQMV